MDLLAGIEGTSRLEVSIQLLFEFLLLHLLGSSVVELGNLDVGIFKARLLYGKRQVWILQLQLFEKPAQVDTLLEWDLILKFSGILAILLHCTIDELIIEHKCADFLLW